MAPSAIEASDEGDTNGVAKGQNGPTNGAAIKFPMESNGSLDNYNNIDLTPCIGREFPTANLVDMMSAPNSDELIAELAMTSMEHSVLWDTRQILTKSSFPAGRSLVPQAGRPQQRPPEAAHPPHWTAVWQAVYFRLAHPPSAEHRG